MDQRLCPYLACLNEQNRRESPTDFPSFENLCVARGGGELVLLGDQATFCLSGEHRSCPRFMAAESAVLYGEALSTQEFASFLSAAELKPEPAGQAQGFGIRPELAAGTPLALAEPLVRDRRRWAWAGAGLVFLAVFLCGSMVATYTGWQWIVRGWTSQAAAGQVETVASEPILPTPAVYVVMTATPAAGTSGPPPTAEVVAFVTAAPLTATGSLSGTTQPFPSAVTPTPILIAPPTFPPEDAAAAAVAVVDVDSLVPTRRPTPVFDVPTSTAVPELPTATPTLSPTPLGTPSIVFAPDKVQLQKGECTLVRWYVQNVREVYYENLPANGQGDHEECIFDDNEVYTLRVVLPDGQTRMITTTVSYLPPTPTPTVTPSFTPIPVYTPTWTPEPPTATAAPDVRYAVLLAVNGDSTLACGVGQSCEVGLLVTNGGDAIDNLNVVLTAGGALPVRLCRPDGVCSSSELPLTSVGPSNTAYVTARFDVPAGTAPQTTTYGLQAVSIGSGRRVTSDIVTITLSVP
jgi:hypothetical protein